MQLGGPFWGGGLHDVNCVEKIIKQITQESSIYKTKEYMLQLLESISDVSCSTLLDTCISLFCDSLN